eukprot:TRINITY_DN4941_c0_g1_i2.p1 TRINITY_DN4941_c0_g1~~TRINITY_DN4941_c0_g1_i2.p1  ORF type:complete len:151 (+),score=18.99 TRINITY_DN4941_c0_g1_i2:36-455(+)
MTDFDSIFRTTKQLVMGCKTQITAMESGKLDSKQQGEVATKLTTVSTNIDKLRDLSRRSTATPLWAKRVELLADDARDIREAFGRMSQQQSARQREEQERQQLFSGYSPNTESSTSVVIEEIMSSTARADKVRGERESE